MQSDRHQRTPGSTGIPVLFLLGPTAVGKSECAVRLAHKVKGEIISCDSMQVYKGMPLLSQQPDKALLAAVPHHLIGTREPEKEWHAALFAEEAQRCIQRLEVRGMVPIVCGGTGLYARALIKGLFAAPPSDKTLRMRLREEADQKGHEQLYRRLSECDPRSAQKIHPNDTRRVIRALEIFALTGTPLSEKQKEAQGIEKTHTVLEYILTRPREELYRRIDARVDEMFRRGVVKEFERLSSRELSDTAREVLGFKELSAYKNGECTLREAQALIQQKTRRYAKRQYTWFRAEKGAEWITCGDKKGEAKIEEDICRRVRALRKRR